TAPRRPGDLRSGPAGASFASAQNPAASPSSGGLLPTTNSETARKSTAERKKRNTTVANAIPRLSARLLRGLRVAFLDGTQDADNHFFSRSICYTFFKSF